MKKKTLWLIAAMLTVAFCSFSFQIECDLSGTDTQMSCDSEANDDDALKSPESTTISYARNDQRVKIERYVRVVERAAAEKATHFHDTEFNDTGLLTETMKRDYSGDDPFDIAA